jgi:hypothetical protein
MRRPTYGLLAVLVSVGVVYLVTSKSNQSPPQGILPTSSKIDLSHGESAEFAVKELIEDEPLPSQLGPITENTEESHLELALEAEPHVDELALGVDTQVQLALERGVITEEEVPAFIDETNMLLQARAADLQVQMEEEVGDDSAEG